MNPYTKSGSAPVALRGHRGVLERLISRLSKPTPDNISLIGPKSIGKTVLLRALADRLKGGGAGYTTALYTDLRFHTPSSDQAFFARLAKELKEALAPVIPDIAALIDLTRPPEALSADLLWIVEQLAEQEHRILIVLDGMDHLLSKPQISRNLWDSLRDIGEHKPTIALVTGSRDKLENLCANPDAQTSNFWGIFVDPQMLLAAFEEADWAEVLAPLAEKLGGLGGGAREEIASWTGGHPALVALLAARLWEEGSVGAALSQQDVKRIAQVIYNEDTARLNVLWADCPPEVRADLYGLASQQPGAQDIPQERLQFSLSRGFLRTSGRQVVIGCEWMRKLALYHADQLQDLSRLLGSEDAYCRNVRGILEMRLAQVRGADPKLSSYIGRAVRDVYPDPALALGLLRQSVNRALELIWEAEAPRRRWPQAWIDAWQHEGEAGAYWIEKAQGAFPSNDGQQCMWLRTITGGRGDLPIVSRFVTRPTYVLVEQLKAAGDFGQHQSGRITTPLAAAMCLTAVELCESLTRDLEAPKG